MVSEGGNGDDPTLGQDPACLARCGDRMAPCIRSDGRGDDRRQSRRSPAQPCLDGSAWADPRSDRAGAVQDVARHELTALNVPSPGGLQDRPDIQDFAQAVQVGDPDSTDAVEDKVPARALSRSP